jgi:hypothetical protein
MPFPGPELVADLQIMEQRRLDCALGHAVDDAVAARAAVVSTRVSPSLLAVHVTAAMRQVLADESWLCEEAEPWYLAPSYRWTLVLEAQTASRDGQDGRHPCSAEWEREYGRGIPGQDCASQLAAVTRWYQDDQRDQARLRAVVWGQRPAPALERAAGATADDQDWTERVASLLEVFAGKCRWPLDYLTPPGPAS